MTGSFYFFILMYVFHYVLKKNLIILCVIFYSFFHIFLLQEPIKGSAQCHLDLSTFKYTSVIPEHLHWQNYFANLSTSARTNLCTTEILLTRQITYVSTSTRKIRLCPVWKFADTSPANIAFYPAVDRLWFL